MLFLSFVDFYSFLVTLFLAGFILIRGQKFLLSRVCAALLACFCLWSLGLIITRNPDTPLGLTKLVYNIISPGWISFSSFFLWLALIFTRKEKILRAKKLLYSLLFIPPVFFIYKQWTNSLIVDYIKNAYGWSYVWSASIWPNLFYSYYLLFMATGLFLIFNFGRKTKEIISKRQARIIFITALISVVGGSWTNVIVQKLKVYSIPPLANIILLVWALGMVYAIVKYRFLAITPAAAAENIISTMLESLILLDNEGTIIGLNKAAMDLLGYRKDELEGKSFSILLPEYLQQPLLDKIVKGESLKGYDIIFITKHLDNISVSFSASALKDNAGNMIGIVCLAMDISDRKKIEEALREGEKKYRTMFELSPEGIIVLDTQGKVMDLNGRLCDWLGYRLGEVVGKNIFELPFMSEMDRIKSKDMLYSRIKGEFVPPYELNVIAKNGQKKIGLIQATLIKDRNNQIVADLVMISDITERKKADDELKASENKYRTLVENIPQKIFLKDRNLIYISCNENYALDLKIRPQEISGKTDFDFYPAELAEKHRKDDKKIMEFGWPVDVEEKYIQDGKEVFIRTSKNPIRNEKGEVVGILGVFWDITDRKLAEEKIRRAAEEWRSTFDSITDMISIHDKDFKILRVNMAFAKAFKMHPRDVIGKTCYELMHGSDKPCAFCPHQHTLDNKRSALIEMFEPCLGIYVEISTSPILNDKGEVISTVHIVEDITQRKELEKEQQLAQLGRLVADMAHEVNNPLMIISGRAQLSLMEKIKDEAINKNLNIIVEECQRANGIIQRLLHFSRPSKGERKPLNINNCIDGVVNIIEHQFGLANITVKRDFLKDPPLILGDEQQFQEIFMNLLTNAKDAMPQGGTINIATSRKKNSIKIDFQDTGRGMPEEVLKKIFQPFVTTKEKGTGLGLAVCYGIIKAHNGEISFESEVGKGTTVTILLPIEGEK